MAEQHTREPQYQDCLDLRAREGLTRLGLMANQVWHDDPRRLVFLLARYKFVAKMFGGLDRVLEIGCADAFGTRIVRQEVAKLTATDFDPVFIADVKTRMNPRWAFDAFVHDMLAGPVPPRDYDGIYALDVLEHIDPKDEDRFLSNLVQSLAPHGAVVLGMPSLESQAYASPNSKAGHVNCKSMPDFKQTMERYFFSVFMFSMNDEVVHTGFHKLAHYLFALGCEPRK
jgi:2-polyprenyl-3-methyl-5-hydroxy-6-metoxy-1,4-benzoquinol methylase